MAARRTIDCNMVIYSDGIRLLFGASNQRLHRTGVVKEITHSLYIVYRTENVDLSSSHLLDTTQQEGIILPVEA